jgi:hypothetical protein
MNSRRLWRSPSQSQKQFLAYEMSVGLVDVLHRSSLPLSVFTHFRKGRDHFQRPIFWTYHDFRKQHSIHPAFHDRYRGTCGRMFLRRGPILSQVVGMNWIEVPPGKYSLLKGKDKKSHCQIELSVRYDIIRMCVHYFEGTDGGQIWSIHITCTRGWMGNDCPFAYPQLWYWVRW